LSVAGSGLHGGNVASVVGDSGVRHNTCHGDGRSEDSIEGNSSLIGIPRGGIRELSVGEVGHVGSLSLSLGELTVLSSRGVSGLDGEITTALGSATSLAVVAEDALEGTALAVTADSALLVTSLSVGADGALVGTRVTADSALGVTSLSGLADSALEVTALTVTADSAHIRASGDGEDVTSLAVGADGALGVTALAVLAELALGVTGGLVSLSGLEDDVVTGEGESLLSNLEGTDDGVDDLLGDGGLDTEDLHVAVGTVLGEGDEVLGGDFSGGHGVDIGVGLGGGGVHGLAIGGDEGSVRDVGLLGGLVGNEGKSENSTAEGGGENSGRNEHLFGTVEATSQSLDGELEASESRATSGFEFHC